eukprot:g6008.t1
MICLALPPPSIAGFEAKVGTNAAARQAAVDSAAIVATRDNMRAEHSTELLDRKHNTAGQRISSDLSMGYHTILLVQRDRDTPNTRVYFELPSTQMAMERVVKLYEARLKHVNPGIQHITYDVQDLFGFVDELGDLSALVLDNETGQYAPHGKTWIKDLLYKYFQAQAN